MITKNALAMALKQHMEKRPFNKISINDLCDTCRMNRKSFYYHFRDKYNLLNWIFQVEIVAPILSKHYDSTWEQLEDLLNYLDKNRKFYINAFKVEGQNSLKEYYSMVMQPILMDGVKRRFTDSVNREMMADFYTEFLLAAIIKWLNEYGKMNPSEFCNFLRYAVEGQKMGIGHRHSVGSFSSVPCNYMI